MLLVILFFSFICCQRQQVVEGVYYAKQSGDSYASNSVCGDPNYGCQNISSIMYEIVIIILSCL
jgi:hypothetical protein